MTSLAEDWLAPWVAKAHSTARAPGTSPEVLTTALAQLSEAGLLTYSYDGAPDAAHATITLLPAGPSSWS